MIFLTILTSFHKTKNTIDHFEKRLCSKIITNLTCPMLKRKLYVYCNRYLANNADSVIVKINTVLKCIGIEGIRWTMKEVPVKVRKAKKVGILNKICSFNIKLFSIHNLIFSFVSHDTYVKKNVSYILKQTQKKI
jgi:hypothetical protein